MLLSLYFAGEQDKEIITLKVLCEAMALKSIKDPCKFLNNEYEVHVHVYEVHYYTCSGMGKQVN